MLSKYGNCTYLLKTKNKLKIGCFFTKVLKNSRCLVGVFNKTIIPLVLVGYEIINANSYPIRTRGIIVNYKEKFVIKILEILFNKFTYLFQINNNNNYY